jgi:hypothetical protein
MITTTIYMVTLKKVGTEIALCYLIQDFNLTVLNFETENSSTCLLNVEFLTRHNFLGPVLRFVFLCW